MIVAGQIKPRCFHLKEVGLRLKRVQVTMVASAGQPIELRFMIDRLLDPFRKYNISAAALESICSDFKKKAGVINA